MNKLLLCITLVSWSALVSHAQDRFYQNKGWSVSSGLHLSYPAVFFKNKNNFGNTIPSLQIWAHKDFQKDKPRGIIAAVGISRDLFNVLRQFESPDGTVTFHRRRINISYAHIEAGGKTSFLKKGDFSLQTSLAFRVSKLLSEDYSELYVVKPNSSDMGFNLRVGPRFKFHSSTLYVQVNFYQGLLKLAENSIITGTVTEESYLRNRSLGLQLGFFL